MTSVDIKRGVCETRYCEEPITHVVRWDELGAEPAYACRQHAHRKRDAEVRVEPVDANEVDR